MKKQVVALVLTAITSGLCAMNSFAAQSLSDRIDFLYRNADQDIRAMETSALKAEISDDFIRSVDEYIPCCTINANEDYLYRMSDMGANAEIVFRSGDGNYTIGVSSHTAEQERVNEADIESLCDFVDGATLTGDLPEIEKLEAINQLLVDTLSYNDEKNTSKAAEAVKTKKATCLGYASLFYLLCINNGIRCEIVGNEHHAFNRVAMTDGSIYYMDTCWNDTDANPNQYFMLTEDELNALNDGSHELAECFRG